jgi:hypothetical protein
MIEDIDDYCEFEAAVIADYEARTAVERELLLRLASLLWRLRRATTSGSKDAFLLSKALLSAMTHHEP